MDQKMHLMDKAGTSKVRKHALKAVIFDMDGVLCDTDEYHFRSWQAAIAPFDIPFNRGINDRLRGLTRRDSLEVLLNGYELTEAEKSSILLEKNASYLDQISQLNTSNLLPGVEEMLCELTAHRIKIGVASASQHVTTVLERLGIASMVQATCRGNQLARTKPDPDPYLFTAAQLKVKPVNCIVVEDSEAGVQAGVAARMCVLGVGPIENLQQAFSISRTLEGISIKKLRAIHKDWLAARDRLTIDEVPLFLPGSRKAELKDAGSPNTRFGSK